MPIYFVKIYLPTFVETKKIKLNSYSLEFGIFFTLPSFTSQGGECCMKLINKIMNLQGCSSERFIGLLNVTC